MAFEEVQDQLYYLLRLVFLKEMRGGIQQVDLRIGEITQPASLNQLRRYAISRVPQTINTGTFSLCRLSWTSPIAAPDRWFVSTRSRPSSTYAIRPCWGR